MYNGINGSNIQPSLDSTEILPPDAKEVARREWQRLNDQLEDIRAQITRLQDREEILEAQVEAWAVILSAGGQCEARETDDSGTSATGPGRLLNKQESADAVVELLRETGEALHYREIYDILEDRGVEVKGKNPPNTLLARFFDDPRLERVRQGTYQIKVVQEVQQNE